VVVPELLRAAALPLGEAAARQLQHGHQPAGRQRQEHHSQGSAPDAGPFALSVTLGCALSVLASHQRLGYQPSGSLLQALLAGLQPQLLGATACQAAQLLGALALWGHHPGDRLLAQLSALALDGASSAAAAAGAAAAAAAGPEELQTPLPAAGVGEAAGGGGSLGAEQAAEALYALAVLGHAPGEQQQQRQLGQLVDWLVLEADCGSGLSMRAIVRLMFAISCFEAWNIQRFGLLCVALREQRTGLLSDGQLLVLKQAQLLLALEGEEMAAEVLPQQLFDRATKAFRSGCCSGEGGGGSAREQQAAAAAAEALVLEALPGWRLQRVGVAGDGGQQWELQDLLLLEGQGTAELLVQLCWGADCCSNADDRLLGPALLLQRMAQPAAGMRRCVVLRCEGAEPEQQRQQLLAAAALVGTAANHTI
jgi:hypothetical protein